MPRIELLTLLELVGELQDNGGASERFRHYLQSNIQTVEDVRAYVDATLDNSGAQFNKALQDLINHVGHLLEFDVVYGRYRGVRGEVGYDGLWRSPSGWAVIVEAKTADVYTVKTAPLLGYINDLVSEGELSDPSQVLGLYVYGRFDAGTSQLENAITVEGRRERLRVVSVEALLHVLELKQAYNLAHRTVLGLLLPAAVRIDPLVNLIFDIVAQEKEESEESAPLALDEEAEEESELNEPLEDREASKQKRSANLVALDQSYTGKTPVAVILFHKRYPVHTWKEATLTVLEVFRRQHVEDFEAAAVTVWGRKRPYISNSADDLRKPERVPHTDLYFETNLSANSMVKLCFTVLQKLGDDESQLSFEVEE